MRQPAPRGDEQHLDQERIAVGDEAIERQRAPAPRGASSGSRSCSRAALQPRDRADVDVGEPAEEPPPQRPVHDRAARHVARADDDVGVARSPRSGRGRCRGSCERSASIWQMTSTGSSMRLRDAVDVRAARGRARPVRCITSTRPGCARASASATLARAVRRLVVDDEHADVRRAASAPSTSTGRFVALVVGRHDDERACAASRPRPFEAQRRDLLGHEADEEDDDAQQDQQHRRVRDVRLRGDRPDARSAAPSDERRER